MRKINRLIIHNSLTNGGDVKFMWDIAVNSHGYSDTSYHFIICNGLPHGDWPAGEDGEIQEGRPVETQGAHAKGHNQDSVGICLIGNFETREPTEKQVHSLIALCSQLCKQFSLDPMKAIVGHRDLNNTDCPGRYLYSMLPLVRLCVKYRLMLGTKVTE